MHGLYKRYNLILNKPLRLSFICDSMQDLTHNKKTEEEALSLWESVGKKWDGKKNTSRFRTTN
jgi:hypothetical protein